MTVVPIQVALQPVGQKAWAREAVILVGIDHELALDAYCAKGLVHLFGILERHGALAQAIPDRRGNDCPGRHGFDTDHR